MLALVCNWSGETPGDPRIAASLGLFAGRPAAFRSEGNVACAWLAGPRDIPAPGWQPARRENGGWLLFNGMIDNPEDVARLLGRDPATRPDILYAAALDRFGDSAEEICVGHYCAASTDGAGQTMRLARSPILGPPLHYHWSPRGCIVASVPRVIAASGLALELDRKRLLDNFTYDHSDQERGWYRDTFMVPTGAVVHIDRDARRATRWHDPLGKPDETLSDGDVLERARELMDEAARRVTAFSQRPALMMSGGLDSTLTAAALLRTREAPARLPCLIFRPDREWDGRTPHGTIGDETALARAMAEAHPRIDLRIHDSAGLSIDHRYRELFMAMGTAPAGLPNFFPMHALWRDARDSGCDGILSASWGNLSITLSAIWGGPELLRQGKWVELARWLAQADNDRSMLRKFLALAVLPQFPARFQAWVRKRVHGRDLRSAAGASPLRRELLGAAHDTVFANPTRSRETFLRYRLEAGDAGMGDIDQGFEQIYGIRTRDVTSYRPLVEFCMRLPTRQLYRNGVDRWLARRLGRDDLPAAVLDNQLYGFQHADWQFRALRDRDSMRAAIDRWRDTPEIAEVLALDEVGAVLDRLEDVSLEDALASVPVRGMLTRAALAGQFIAFATGSNQA